MERKSVCQPRVRTLCRSWIGEIEEEIPCSLLTDEDLELFLLQLVQALRYEEDPYRKEEKQITVERVIRMVKQKSSEVSPITMSDDSPIHLESSEEPTRPANETATKPANETVNETPTKPANETANEPTNESSTNAALLFTEGGMVDGSELSNSMVEATQPDLSASEANAAVSEPEVIDDVIEGTIQEVQTITVVIPVSPLLQFLVNRCSVKRSLASLFIRYLRVEATTEGNKSDNESRSAEGSKRVEYADMESCFLFHLKNQEDSSVYEAILKEDRIVEIVRWLSFRLIDSSSDSAIASPNSAAARRRSRKTSSCCSRATIARFSAIIRCSPSVRSSPCRTFCRLQRRFSSPR